MTDLDNVYRSPFAEISASRRIVGSLRVTALLTPIRIQQLARTLGWRHECGVATRRGKMERKTDTIQRYAAELDEIARLDRRFYLNTKHSPVPTGPDMLCGKSI